MIGWHNDKRWSDRFLPEIKAFLGQTFIGEASIEDDQRRNTDLITLTIKPLRFACRVRRYDAFQEYWMEFTLRNSRPFGAKTELEKVLEGWGDYLVYGFANQYENSLQQMFIGDLTIFRQWYTAEIARRRIPGVVKDNFDGSSSFRVFELRQLPPKFIVAVR